MLKHFALLILLCLCSHARPAHAAEVYVGTITATTTAQNNATTGTPFAFGARTPYVFWCDAPGVFAWYSDSVSTVTATTGIPTPVNSPWDTRSGMTQKWVSIQATSGTINCYFFRVI